jgi:hypothetical protein
MPTIFDNVAYQGLSRGARLLYFVLAVRADGKTGVYTLSHQKLMSDLNLKKEDTLIALLLEVEKSGLISVHRCPGRCNVYKVNHPRKTGVLPPPEIGGTLPPPKNGTPEKGVSFFGETTPEKRDIIQNLTDNTLLVDEIFNLYPNRCPVKNRSTGKSNADKKRIAKLLQTKSLDELTTAIIGYVSDCQHTNTYLKNFGTLLNNLPEPLPPAPEVLTPVPGITRRPEPEGGWEARQREFMATATMEVPQ